MLTIDDAIKIALEKNFSVLLARNEVEINKLRNNAGNAGMAPQLGLNANYGLANVDSYMEFQNGTNQDRKGAQNTNTGAGLNASWVVFDGLKMFAVKKRLAQTEKLSELQQKNQMEELIVQVILSYYTIVRLEKLKEAAEFSLEIVDERLKLQNLSLQIGSASKVDVLITQTDANKLKAEIIKYEQDIQNAKIELNVLMTKPADNNFTVPKEIQTNYNPAPEELKKSVVSNNTSILISRQQESIEESFLKESKSFLLPQVQLNGAYNFVLNQSQAGFVLLNRQLGVNAGISASWMLFNGNKNNRLYKEKQVSLLNSRFLIDKSIQETDAMVFMQFKTFESAKKLLTLEEENLVSAKELITISLERFKQGKSNLIETKEVQKIHDEAQIRYINAMYEAKKAETMLLRANGSLIK